MKLRIKETITKWDKNNRFMDGLIGLARVGQLSIASYKIALWFASMACFYAVACEPVVIYTAGAYPFNAAIAWVVDFVADKTGLPIITRHRD